MPTTPRYLIPLPPRQCQPINRPQMMLNQQKQFAQPRPFPQQNMQNYNRPAEQIL